MKIVTTIALFLALLIMGCSTSKSNSKTSNNESRMEFTVTKIQNKKDGQTIFMDNNKGGQYITIISPANGNWIELNVGDKISLTAREIMESNPTQFISKDIKVLGSEPSSGIEYEKTEEETY